MYFPILLCHASMHSWKDSSIIIALLMAPMSRKQAPLMTILSFGKGKKSHQASKEVSLSQQETAGCSGCYGEAVTSWPAITLITSCTDLLHAQIFSDNLPEVVAAHVQHIYNQLNNLPTIGMHLHWLVQHSMLVSILLVEGFLLLGSSPVSIFEPLVTRKLFSTTLSHHICCSSLSASDSVFPRWTRNFRLVHCTVHITLWSKIEELLIKVHEKIYNGHRKLKSVIYRLDITSHSDKTC